MGLLPLALLCLPLPRARAQAVQSGAPAQPANPAAPVQDELYLEVSVNDEASGLILRFTQGKQGLRSSVDNLSQLGLDPAVFGLAGQTEVALDEVKGLHYTYDAAKQTLTLRIDDAYRKPYEVTLRPTDKAGPAMVTPGAVLNYDAYEQVTPQSHLSVYNELRYFNARGVFSSTGTATFAQGSSSYLRYDTFWNESDPDTLKSFQVGDMISSSQSWSRSIRMGGLQWRKNFELRPDLLTFPVASVNGSSALPSALSLYVNGIQQYNTTVPSGPFVINQVAGLNGAGQATVITRDALGRSVATTLPLYVDTRMLAAGLSDYSVEMGVPRLGYASRSFDYEKSPEASASWRSGLSDVLTLQAHAEVGPAVYNAGAGALYRLGQAGVVNGSLAGSAGQRSGGQLSLGYQYIGPRYGIDVQTQRASAGYGDLAVRDGAVMTRTADRVSLNMALFGGQSLSLSYVGYRAPLAAPAHIASLGYSLTVGSSVFASVSGFQDLRQRENRGFFFSLSFALSSHISASATTGRQNGNLNRSVNLISTPDFGGGFGWGLQSGALNETRYQQAQLTYLGSKGQLTATTQSNGDNRASAVDLSGALVLMDGSVSAARQVGAGFALVSTEGVPNVPVLHENRQIGVTDGGGHLLIPNLNAYANNAISIDTSALPVDARVRDTELNIVPKNLSGVLARFPVERYRAATIIIHDAAGKPLAPGLVVRHVESGASTVLGFDGMTFVDNLGDDNHLRVGEGAAECEVHFAYQRSKDSSLPQIGPLVCGAPGAPQAPALPAGVH
jgi:outer membrane usher protein